MMAITLPDTSSTPAQVHEDRIERPPKSTMRLGDFIRMLSLRTDANLTLYSRQARLWSMSGLLEDLAPLPWMSLLRVKDLNVWIGDGHFRNTLHFDPQDNFLCQVRGTKHVLTYPPSAKADLYFGPRRDIQANYLPTRGEHGRRDTGIVSENTAQVNGAAPDLDAFPRFARARAVERYAELRPTDCLYLPDGWPHHVFSEADADAGFNLAINVWVSREAILEESPPNPDVAREPFPTLEQLMHALANVSGRTGVNVSGGTSVSVSGETIVSAHDAGGQLGLSSHPADGRMAVTEPAEGSCITDDG